MRNSIFPKREPGSNSWLLSFSWEQRKLEDVFQKIRNAFVGTATPFYVKDGHFYLESNNVKDGEINRNSEVFINDEFYEKQRDNWLHSGDIVMVQSGHVGHSAVIPDSLNDTAAHALIIIANPKQKICPHFVNVQFMSPKAKKNIGNITTGNTIKHILASDMKVFEILLPSHMEQTRIGQFFKSLDRLITLHQRKYDKLTKIKKSMLEKMFPKNGSNVPEIRFSGFSDAWEQRKVNEIADIVGGGTPSTHNPSYWDGDINWYAPAEMEGKRYAVTSERKITQAGLSNSSAKILPAGRTILFTSRAGIGKVAILQHDAATNQGFQSLVLKDGISPYFIYSMGSILKKKAEGIASGSTFLEISGKMLGNIDITIPISSEQHIIADFFRNLDDLITLHQRERLFLILEEILC